MTITKSLVTALVSIAVFASSVIAPSPVEGPDQESEEEKEQRIEKMKALVEELFKTSDEDNNDALSLDEFVDLQYQLEINLAKKPHVVWTTPEPKEEHTKRGIKKGLEPVWGELGTDENDEVPKKGVFTIFLGEDYEAKENNNHSERANPSRDEEGIDPNTKQEPASNEPSQSDTVTR